jgi:hypothetical protein
MYESETKLRANATVWVDPSRGEANIAITIKIKRGRPLLKIDQWEWNAATGKPRFNSHQTSDTLRSMFDILPTKGKMNLRSPS